jgi:hypothetical protein
MLPVAFLGVDGEVESQAPSEGPSVGEVYAQDVLGLFEGTDVTLAEEAAAQMADLLHKSASEASFKRNALALAGENEGLRQAVMRGDLWKLRGA